MTVSKSIVKDPEKNVWDHVIDIGPEETSLLHIKSFIISMGYFLSEGNWISTRFSGNAWLSGSNIHKKFCVNFNLSIFWLFHQRTLTYYHFSDRESFGFSRTLRASLQAWKTTFLTCRRSSLRTSEKDSFIESFICSGETNSDWQ